MIEVTVVKGNCESTITGTPIQLLAEVVIMTSHVLSDILKHMELPEDLEELFIKQTFENILRGLKEHKERETNAGL